jgi:hypothetical protein
MKTKSISKGNDENISTHTEAYYEELASQEQKYLDETEENLRAILTSDSESGRSRSHSNRHKIRPTERRFRKCNVLRELNQSISWQLWWWLIPNRRTEIYIAMQRGRAL